MRHSEFGSLAVLAAVFAVACGPTGGPAAAEPVVVAPVAVAPEEPPPVAPEPVEPPPPVASAELTGPPGSSVRGVITFTERADGVAVHAEVEGVPDAGEHGFHLHEVGDCSAADFASAGGHFNPAGAPHAGPHDVPRHAGDLGNLTVGADGTGTLDLVAGQLTVRAGPDSVVGRAVILHAARDDLSTQPTGSSGARIACGTVHVGGPGR